MYVHFSKYHATVSLKGAGGGAMEIDEVYQQIGESGRQQLLYGAALFLLKVQSFFFKFVTFN